jgi:hypothetical protein
MNQADNRQLSLSASVRPEAATGNNRILKADG